MLFGPLRTTCVADFEAWRTEERRSKILCRLFLFSLLNTKLMYNTSMCTVSKPQQGQTLQTHVEEAQQINIQGLPSVPNCSFSVLINLIILLTRSNNQLRN